jgi:hypothetical protein
MDTSVHIGTILILDVKRERYTLHIQGIEQGYHVWDISE